MDNAQYAYLAALIDHASRINERGVLIETWLPFDLKEYLGCGFNSNENNFFSLNYNYAADVEALRNAVPFMRSTRKVEALNEYLATAPAVVA